MNNHLLLLIVISMLSGCKSFVDYNPASSEKQIPVYRENEEIISYEYLIGLGDILKFQVLYHSEYNMLITIPPNEVISLPRIPNYSTKNKSLNTIRLEISKLLSKYLKLPDVTVNVEKFSIQKIVILGKVKRPGIYSYQKGMSLPMSIAMAGGMENHANTTQISISSKNKKPYLVTLDFDNPQASYPFINAGDIIIVPEKPIHSLNIFINQFFTKTNPILRYYLNILDIKNYDETYRTR